MWDFYQTEGREIFNWAMSRFVFLTKKVRRLIQNGKILDIGFGDGRLLAGLSGQGRELYGIDISEKNVVLTQDQFKTKGLLAEFKFGNINAIPYQDAYFDCVVASEVLEHVDDDTLRRGLSEIKRVLKPGGYLVITTPADEKLDENLVYCPDCQKQFHRWGHKQSFSMERISSWLAPDYNIERIKKIALYSQTKPVSGLGPILKYYILFCLFHLVSPFRSLQRSFYIVCQPK